MFMTFMYWLNLLLRVEDLRCWGNNYSEALTYSCENDWTLMLLFKITQKHSLRDRLNPVNTNKQGKDNWESFPFLHNTETQIHTYIPSEP